MAGLLDGVHQSGALSVKGEPSEQIRSPQKHEILNLVLGEVKCALHVHHRSTTEQWLQTCTQAD